MFYTNEIISEMKHAGTDRHNLHINLSFRMPSSSTDLKTTITNLPDYKYITACYVNLRGAKRGV
jgi:hypothetical protein